MFRFLIRRIRSWKTVLSPNESLIRVVIHRSNLLHNLHVLQSLAPKWQVAPVLKSNAYGHGLVLVADILKDEPDIPFFCVDSYFEAKALRAAGITKDVLVFDHATTSSIKNNRLRGVSFAITSIDQLKELIAAKVDATIHIKFDTGMHRQGILHTDLDESVALLRQQSSLIIDGVFSHFAESETPGSKLTDLQIERWNAIAERFKKEFPAIRFYHLANSAGFAHASRITANVGRTGIALYGIDPGNLVIPLKPALSMASIITEVRTIAAGELVGYNGTFVASRPSKIATVPVGYFEGVDRRLSNKGAYFIEGHAAPIAGTVSMNLSSCDVTAIPSVRAGSTVTIFSHDLSAQNSIISVAKLCGTIPYEILVRIPAHLRRTMAP